MGPVRLVSSNMPVRTARSPAADCTAGGTASAKNTAASNGGGNAAWNATVVAFGVLSGVLIASGAKDYPNLHTVLDTAMCLLSGALALLLWDTGGRIGGSFPRLIAIAFAATSLLEFIHVIVIIEWSGPLAAVAANRSFLRPATWPPAAHLLPIGIWSAIWLRRHGVSMVAWYAAAIVIVAAGLFAAFEWLPTYTPPGLLWITRPALVLAPLLWAAVGSASWRARSQDRFMWPLAQAAPLLVLANVAMLYSEAPHDTQAMIAHLGRVCGYLALLLHLMQFASIDMLERIHAEAKLARSNEDLERRVLERTAQLEAAAAARRSDMQRLADDFEAAVGGFVDAVSASASELEATASTLTNTAERTQQLSAAVAATSGQVSSHVQSVASVTDEMARSVNKIGRQVQDSNSIAREAVSQAEKTDARITKLSQAANRIGDVVNLIAAIAGQTNLLALNATIEAARAGDAGRGFAVVAQEVKALAAQTAKATEEIGMQIANMQTATQESVVAIKEIGGTIGRISELASAITAAVEDQGASTRDIARTAQQAALGTSQVANNISEVNREASETEAASSRVLVSARSLSGEGSKLKVEMEKFLATVHAA
jgi:methyl-accepting chemotaxis protein